MKDWQAKLKEKYGLTIKRKLTDFEVMLVKRFCLTKKEKKAVFLLLGAGIAGIIATIMVARLSSVSGLKEAAQEVQQLSTNIRRYYQNRPDFWGLDTQTVVEKAILPQNMSHQKGLQGFWGNPVLVGNGSEGAMLMPGSRTFDIVYKNLNRKQCMALAPYKFDEQFFMGLSYMVLIKDNTQETFTWDDKVKKLPITTAMAKEFCAENNHILWHFQ